ncbi:hypothetical protein [Nocardia asiatica]|uniref:hypothetical protein n=1 Tax=Nocardia asiatica TaxID=209252 RepID=UPI003EE3954B
MLGQVCGSPLRDPEPLALTPVDVVDTTAAVDCPELARQVIAAAAVAIDDFL